MFSSKIDKWSSPLPLTLKPSDDGNSSTSRPTFVSNSLCKRSLICLVVKNLPLCPANGPLLTKKFIDSVGFSISIGGNGSIQFNSLTVSPIDICEQPAIVTISP